MLRLADGDRLLAACHPRALTFVKYSKAPMTSVAPCEVLQFDNTLNESRRNGSSVTYPRSAGSTVYLDAVGDEFSACAVAAVVEGAMWLGSVHDRGLLRCTMT